MSMKIRTTIEDISLGRVCIETEQQEQSTEFVVTACELDNKNEPSKEECFATFKKVGDARLFHTALRRAFEYHIDLSSAVYQ